MTLSSRPRFSVLIPTRDRPAYVRNALESVLNQSFGDFEVIVCDNFKDHSCKAVVDAFADPRVRYIQPPVPLAMHDNWEFAIDQARGDFVLILIDKTLLRLSALERLQAATQTHPAEVYSWTSDVYYLTAETEGDVGSGYIVPVRGQGEPFYVDCASEIAERMSCRVQLGTEGPAYAWGKICFGAYSRELIARIKARFGKVCPLISPDYTSKTVALLSTDRLVDLNGSYTVSLVTSVSNGMLFSQDSGHARRFLAQVGFSEREFADLPIPHVFCSVHNICAYDWRLAGPDYLGRIDMAYLYLHVERDIATVQQWASEQERTTINEHLKAFLARSSIELRERILTIRAQWASDSMAQKEKALEAREVAVREFESALKIHGENLKEHEEWLISREANVSARESHVAMREDQALQRETSALGRETAVQAREDTVTHFETIFAPLLKVYGVLLRACGILRKEPALVPPEASPATAPAEVASPPEALLGPIVNGYPAFSSTIAAPPEALLGPIVNGYPAFSSTIAALRYAEGAHYTYPMPKPAPLEKV